MGMELKYIKHYWKFCNNEPTAEAKDSREKVANFYKSIDVHIAFRPHGVFAPFKTPLKLANSGAYGVPTVCFPEANYVKEWPGCFIPALNMNEMIEGIKKLKEDKVYYQEMSKKVIERAEPYHVDNILKLYKKLT
jgi:hypothetical protein